jgi:hypothetical protein
VRTYEDGSRDDINSPSKSLSPLSPNEDFNFRSPKSPRVPFLKISNNQQLSMRLQSEEESTLRAAEATLKSEKIRTIIKQSLHSQRSLENQDTKIRKNLKHFN